MWWPVLISGLSVPAASGFTRLVNSPRVPMGHFFPRISLRIHHNGKNTAHIAWGTMLLLGLAYEAVTPVLLPVAGSVSWS